MTPGSDEALTSGCLCPVLDNDHGKRADGQFWTNEHCPLHGRLCADCGHSIWLHPEMAYEGTDGTCSGEEDCKCKEFKGRS